MLAEHARFALISVVLGVSGGSHAMATSTKIETSYQFQGTHSDVGAPEPFLSQNITRHTQSLFVRAEGIEERITLGAGLSSVVPDYSQIRLRDRTGAEKPLADVLHPANVEFTGQAYVSWAKDEDLIELNLARPLSASPFAENRAELAYARTFYSQTTSLGARFLYVGADQPATTYIDVDFVTRDRPTHVNAYRAALEWDQILSAQYKLGLDVFISERVEERPPHVGFTLKQGYAVTKRVFTRLDFTYADELSSVGLQNERGYFSYAKAVAGIFVEPVYDLLLGASATAGWEGENDPRTARAVQVGVLGGGLSARYDFRPWLLEASGNYGRTNTALNDVTVQMGLTYLL